MTSRQVAQVALGGSVADAGRCQQYIGHKLLQYIGTIQIISNFVVLKNKLWKILCLFVAKSEFC